MTFFRIVEFFSELTTFQFVYNTFFQTQICKAFFIFFFLNVNYFFFFSFRTNITMRYCRRCSRTFRTWTRSGSNAFRISSTNQSASRRRSSPSSPNASTAWRSVPTTSIPKRYPLMTSQMLKKAFAKMS